jgi:hypothetical protein
VSCKCVSVSEFDPPTGILPFPFISQGAMVGSRCSPSLYMGPISPVDDVGIVLAPLPGVTCDVRVNKAPACTAGVVRSDKTGGVSPQQVLRLNPQSGR